VKSYSVRRISARSLGRFALALAVPAMLTTSVAAQPAKKGPVEHEVVITIEQLKALDRMDVFSRADFFARVTIGGAAQSTPTARQVENLRPNWQIVKRVPAGVTDVKVEVFDKDVTKADPVDVNRVANKRDLDFKVNTRSCRVSGFAQSYRCGQSISRAGGENKKAELTFKVTVNKP
jgi:hypothetical protein